MSKKAAEHHKKASEHHTHAARHLRAALCRKLAWLGIKLDERAIAAGGPRISARDSAVSVWVIPTNEELMIAQHTLALVRP